MESGNGKRDAGSSPRRAIRSYEDIEAFQSAMELLVPLHQIILKFPDYERFELGSQLRRASKSIPANIAEGYGKKSSDRQFKAYLSNALGSANEVIVHLRIAERLGYCDATDIRDLVARYTVVAKQLHRLSEAWQTFEGRAAGAVPPPASRLSLPAKKE